MSKTQQGHVYAGIDSGTTFSALAIQQADGGVKIAVNKEGELLTPSVVNLIDEANPVVGRTALNQRAFKPHHTFSLFKRTMGRTDSEGQPLPAGIHPDSGRVFLPEELTAMVLRAMVAGAQENLGIKIGGAVITVPAYFENAGRLAVKKAGELAGIKVLRILNEPTAAAIAYGLDKSRDGNYVFFDYGGGTFDVTVMEIKGQTFRVMATDGDRDKGGSDLDNLLAVTLAERFKAATGKEISPAADLMEWYELLEKCEILKKNLSDAAKSCILISAQGKRLEVEMSREEFSALIAENVKETLAITERAIKAAKLTWKKITDVVLVGGSTRIPLVRELLKKASGKDPRTDINPDEAVARGAAIEAARVAAEQDLPIVDTNGKKVLPAPYTPIDVNAHALGCLALNTQGVLRNAVMIPANTPLPAVKEDRFCLERENQTGARITIVQGPEEALPDACTIIGEVVLDDLPPGLVNLERIMVRYTYSVEGILEVTASDQVSGKSTNGRIEYRAALGTPAAV